MEGMALFVLVPQDPWCIDRSAQREPDELDIPTGKSKLRISMFSAEVLSASNDRPSRNENHSEAFVQLHLARPTHRTDARASDTFSDTAGVFCPAIGLQGSERFSEFENRTAQGTADQGIDGVAH